VIWLYVQIFFIGILEDFLSSFNTKTIQRNNEFFSFSVSFFSVLLWYYVIVIFIDNINKFWLILTYATGGGFGDIVTIRFDKQIQTLENGISDFFKQVRFRWPIEFTPQNAGRKKKRRQKSEKRLP